MVHKRIGKKDSVDAKFNEKQSTLNGFGFVIKNVTKAIKKIKKTSKNNECNNKAVIICGYFKNFYCCLYALEDSIVDSLLRELCSDYPNCDNCDYSFDCPYEIYVRDGIDALLYGEIYNENGEIDYTEVKPLLWKENNYWLGKCECKPTRTMDGEIVERDYVNKLSKYEPCRFRCAYLQEKGKCQYEKERKIKESTKQKKLDRYVRR
jgi:hypothetical protein